MKFSRREFGRLALATIPAGYAARVGVQTAAQTAARPNSVVRGVAIGMNLPYNFGGRNAPIDDIINNCVALGISVLELRTQPIETFLGAPDRLMPISQPRRAGGATPEQLARAEAAAIAVKPELDQWRLGVSLDRLADLRRRFEAAGIAVPIVRVDGMLDMSDGVIDYQVRLAKACGARAISTEIAESDPERLGKFADQHQLFGAAWVPESRDLPLVILTERAVQLRRKEDPVELFGDRSALELFGDTESGLRIEVLR